MWHMLELFFFIIIFLFFIFKLYIPILVIRAIRSGVISCPVRYPFAKRAATAPHPGPGTSIPTDIA
jgi:hypothetical protein